MSTRRTSFQKFLAIARSFSPLCTRASPRPTPQTWFKEAYFSQHFSEADSISYKFNLGLHVDVERPWLGYSPDGVVTVTTSAGETIEFLVEAKCPFSKKDLDPTGMPIYGDNHNIPGVPDVKTVPKQYFAQVRWFFIVLSRPPANPHHNPNATRAGPAGHGDPQYREDLLCRVDVLR